MLRPSIACALALLLLAPALPASPTQGRFLVGLVSGEEAPAGSFHGASVEARSDALGVLAVRADAAALARVRADPRVAYVEAEGTYDAHAAATDPRYPSQYNLHPATTDVQSAWDLGRGSASVRVCVADTGVHQRHEDLSGARWAGWRDLVGGRKGAYDDNGHGTHVVGILAAQADNGRGIAGVAPASTFLVAKVLDASGSGSWSAIAEGVTWCADQGAHVIGLSLGGRVHSATLARAVEHAQARGALVVASAGNEGCAGCVTYPAALPGVVAVACTDAANRACALSSSGPEVALAAPGIDVLSTSLKTGACRADCYGLRSGTSQAVPHVVGVAALAKARHPEQDSAGLRAALESAAMDVGAAGRDDATGHGVVRGAAVG